MLPIFLLNTTCFFHVSNSSVFKRNSFFQFFTLALYHIYFNFPHFAYFSFLCILIWKWYLNCFILLLTFWETVFLQLKFSLKIKASECGISRRNTDFWSLLMNIDFQKDDADFISKWYYRIDLIFASIWCYHCKEKSVWCIGYNYTSLVYVSI